LIVGNYYVLTLLAFIAATACGLVLARRVARSVASPLTRDDNRENTIPVRSSTSHPADHGG